METRNNTVAICMDCGCLYTPIFETYGGSCGSCRIPVDYIFNPIKKISKKRLGYTRKKCKRKGR